MMNVARLTAAAALAAASLCSTAANAADITGAGATFPYPIYAKWADAYKKSTGNGMNYQSIGSGGGIKQITAKTVDFGASDMPMKAEDLQKNGLVQFPAIMGGVVPVYKIDGIKPGDLRFTGALLADIYLGKVKKWNDPAIVKLNPGVKLPGDDIAVVHRSDGSGTTFLWTNYLSKVSPDFKSTVGEGTSVKWPTGVGGKGNEGVASYVQKINGAIGYVEYAYAKQNKLPHGQVQNKAGKFVQPDDVTFKAAAAGADWKSVPGMGVVLTDQAGDTSWPITGASFILIHAKQEKPDAGREVLKFFDWSFRNGAKMADELDYVPMPDPVVKEIQAAWKTVTDGAGKPIY
jgi:phosphate transport system substrate-binding protein